MSGLAEKPPAGNGATRLERAVELLLAGVELLRAEIDEARNDGDKQGGDHGDHGDWGDQPPAG